MQYSDKYVYTHIYLITWIGTACISDEVLGQKTSITARKPIKLALV